MKPELIAQKMTEIDDRYVLESDPDTVAATVHRRSRSAAVADFFSHGWGVAIISGFVALSVLGGIVAAGQIHPGTTPAGTLPPTTLSSEPTETEAPTEAPQPTPVYTEGLEFRVEHHSGEATLIGMGTATDTILRIPPKDPSGHPVTTIASRAFKGNTTITEVILPASICSVDSGSFADCTSLERVTVEGDKKVVKVVFWSHCFENCPKLTDVRLHEKVVCMDYCFSGTPWLASRTEEFVIQGQSLLAYNGEGGDVVIPAEVFFISGTAFAGNTTIRSITAPDTGVNMSVGNEAFRGCTALETVDLPCLVNIGANPFAGCTALKTVYLPESLSFVGYMKELPENVVFRYAGTKAQWKQVWFTFKEDRAPMEEQVVFEGE